MQLPVPCYLSIWRICWKKYQLVESIQARALQLRRDRETASQSLNLLLGKAKGQTRRTKGTVLFYVHLGTPDIVGTLPRQ